MNIKSLVNVEEVIELLSSVVSDIKWYSQEYNFKRYIRNGSLQSKADKLKKLGYDYEDIKAMASGSYNDFLVTSKNVDEHIKVDLEKLALYQYKKILVNGSYYNFKSAYYSEYNGKYTLRLATVSCHTKEELNALVASIQRGIGLDINHDRVNTIKSGYDCQFTRIADENLGDGYHGIIHQTDTSNEKVVMVFNDNPVKVIYNYIEKNIDKTGLISQWDSYLYNRLTDEGLLTQCEGFSFSNDINSPSNILVISNKVNNELIMKYKMEGIKTGEIELPVVENVELKADATFVELVDQYVIPNLQNEICDYNVGEPICNTLKKPFYKGNKKCYLYPRQQVMGQGVINALNSGKRNIFLACGMGVGKTAISSEAILSHAIENNKVNNSRVLIYAPGHIIPKWHKEMDSYAKSQGVSPTFYSIERFTDIKNIPNKAKGFEVFLIPKDKAKRSYLQDFNVNNKYGITSMVDISNFINSIKSKEYEGIILEKYNNPITSMRAAATKVASKYKLPTVLYKELVDGDGNVIEYKVCISSRNVRRKLKASFASYDFKVKDVNKFVASLDLEVMENDITERNSYLHNGLVCPDCGGFIYDDPLKALMKDKWADNIKFKPSTRNDKNNNHFHYVKADGTHLMSSELKAIRNGKVKFVFTDKKMVTPYLDMDGGTITGEDLIKVKSGYYTEEYQIALKLCDHKLWGAISKNGYNTVNVGDMMIKKFGKNSFDYLIADEAHVFQAQSNQGLLYAKLCRLSKMRLNLTGTLTNGKSSSLFYMFYALFPRKMKEMGYKYTDVSLWIEHYGRRKEVEKEYTGETYNKSGGGKRTSSGWNEIPGFSPLLYSNFLADIMISRTIEDMGIPMPPIKYISHKVEMDNSLKSGYEDLKDDMLKFMKQNKGVSLGGSYIHNLMAYPDYPVQDDIFAAGMLVARPTKIEVEGLLLNKEQKLIDTIKKELQQERRTLVTSVYSGEKGVSKRLVDVIRSQGILVAELTSSIKLEKREDWIQKQYDKGIECIVTNPKCIETGLECETLLIEKISH